MSAKAAVNGVDGHDDQLKGGTQADTHHKIGHRFAFRRQSSKASSATANGAANGKTNGIAEHSHGDLDEERHRHIPDDVREMLDNQDAHSFLQGVRLDEIVQLSQNKQAVHSMHEQKSWYLWFTNPIARYADYLQDTWTDIFRIFIHFEMPVSDFLGTLFLAIATSTVLFFAMIWCQFANNPLILSVYYWWAHKHAGGLGLVNAANPNFFNALTETQVGAAKEKLGVPIFESQSNDHIRVFDLDIAKFLLQLASVVYEREGNLVHSTMDAMRVARANAEKEVAAKETARGGQGQGGLFSLFRRHRGGSAADAAKPSKQSRIQQTSAATHSTRQKSTHHPVGDHEHEHIAQQQQQQQRPQAKRQSSIGAAVDFFKESGPGGLVKDLFGHGKASEDIHKAFDKAHSSTGMSTLADFCVRMGIDFEPVSELNNGSSAFCSFFWKPKGNWIVVTFKGTGAIEYSDWVTDLTVSLTSVDHFLPGYGKAVKGFIDRIYPKDLDDSECGGTRPWDTIRYAICKLSEALHAQNGGHEVNVWFTGHSLGCALATLAYARALNEPRDFEGYPVSIRDAYIFAAPIVGNRQCAYKFNEKMRHPVHGRLRTMWRVTNHDDAIATLLPELGDRTDLKISDTNPAGYAHLGAEIKMKDSPQLSIVHSPTEHIRYLSTVEIRSKFTPEEIIDARQEVLRTPGERRREEIGIWAQNIPLIGRFIAHDTVLYWDQLDRMAIGRVKWLTASE